MAMRLFVAALAVALLFATISPALGAASVAAPPRAKLSGSGSDANANAPVDSCGASASPLLVAPAEVPYWLSHPSAFSFRWLSSVPASLQRELSGPVAVMCVPHDQAAEVQQAIAQLQHIRQAQKSGAGADADAAADLDLDADAEADADAALLGHADGQWRDAQSALAALSQADADRFDTDAASSEQQLEADPRIIRLVQLARMFQQGQQKKEGNSGTGGKGRAATEAGRAERVSDELIQPISCEWRAERMGAHQR